MIKLILLKDKSIRSRDLAMLLSDKSPHKKMKAFTDYK